MVLAWSGTTRRCGCLCWIFRVVRNVRFGVIGRSRLRLTTGVSRMRNHSAPLTRWRHKTGSTHSLLLQRGGHWSATDAVKKWSTRRNQLVYAQRKAVEGTDKALKHLERVRRQKARPQRCVGADQRYDRICGAVSGCSAATC